MKAVILAGGLGTRLLPLTQRVPKVMVKINGKPLLWYHIQLLKLHNIQDIWICVYYLPEIIVKYFGDGSKFGVRINYSYEKEPLGTAGALKNPHSEIEKFLRMGRFVVVYGDNLTDFNYSRLVKLHQLNNSFMTLGLYRSPEPWLKGIVETNKQGKVTRMVEKPPREEITTDQVNSGIYVCEKRVLDYITPGFCDFGHHVIPELLVKGEAVYGFAGGDYIQDIGTPDGLKNAQRAVKSLDLTSNSLQG